MRKENSTIQTKFISEPGSYLHNADYFAFVELNDCACYAIADGIDNDVKRESAKLAVTAVITEFSENPGVSAGKLKRYLNVAHQTLLEEAVEMRLECSIVVLVTDYKKAMWASAGNTRLYLLRNGLIKSKTKDTSLSQRMIDSQELALDKLAYHEERHNLYSYLGQAGRFVPLISKKKKLEDGDIFVLMTRGVWENVGDAELLDAIEDVSAAEMVCTGLEDVILSQQLEVVENYTIASVFVDKVYRNPKAGMIKKTMKIVTAVLMAVLMLAFGFAFSKYRTNKKNYDQMMKCKERGVEFLVENNYVSAASEFTQAIEKADAIGASEDSEKGKQVKIVGMYHKLCGYLAEAQEALTASEYKKAEGKYTDAVTTGETLVSEYSETDDYLEDLEVYKKYSGDMRAGVEFIGNGKYEDAKEALTAASEGMNTIDDVEKRNVADQYLTDIRADGAVEEGDQYAKEAEALEAQGIYSQALVQYQSARKAYEFAKDSYGNADAESKMSLMDIKIENIQNMINKQSNQDLEREADAYVLMGNDALHKGDYEEAAANYESAKEIYQKTENNDQIMAMNAKIEEATYGPGEDEALNSILEAIPKLASGDLPGAKGSLQQAVNAYSQMGDAAHAAQVQAALSQLP